VENLNLRHIYIIRFLIFFAFFARLASKFEKSTNMTFKKVSFLNLKTGVPKNAEFCADFKSVKIIRKIAKKKFLPNTSANSNGRNTIGPIVFLWVIFITVYQNKLFLLFVVS